MRLKDMMIYLREEFVITYGAVAAEPIADALAAAQHGGVGTFTWDGTLYTITAVWQDGCIAGDCNPATCYTNWEISRG